MCFFLPANIYHISLFYITHISEILKCFFTAMTDELTGRDASLTRIKAKISTIIKMIQATEPAAVSGSVPKTAEMMSLSVQLMNMLMHILVMWAQMLALCARMISITAQLLVLLARMLTMLMEMITPVTKVLLTVAKTLQPVAKVMVSFLDLKKPVIDYNMGENTCMCS